MSCNFTIIAAPIPPLDWPRNAHSSGINSSIYMIFGKWSVSTNLVTIICDLLSYRKMHWAIPIEPYLLWLYRKLELTMQSTNQNAVFRKVDSKISLKLHIETPQPKRTGDFPLGFNKIASWISISFLTLFSNLHSEYILNTAIWLVYCRKIC